MPLPLVDAAQLAGVKHQRIVIVLDEAHDFSDQERVIPAGIACPYLALENRRQAIDQWRAGDTGAMVDIGEFVRAAAAKRIASSP